MIVPGSPSPLIAALIKAGAYSLEHSVRFNPDFGMYAYRVFASAGNQKTMTWAFWFKPDRLAQGAVFSTPIVSGTSELTLRFNNGYLQLWDASTGTAVFQTASPVTDSKYWHHGCIGIDTLQDAAGDRVTVEIDNLVQALSFNNLAKDQVLAFNQAAIHAVGRQATIDADRFSGYLCDFHYISGSKLRASEFVTSSGSNATFPKQYSRKSPFGINGFYLPFNSGLYVSATASSVSWTAPGTYTVLVPAGYTISYTLMGGGGGGSGSRTNNWRGWRNNGVGGRASSDVVGTLDCVEDSTFTIVVGAGGAPGGGSSGDSAPDNYPGGQGGSSTIGKVTAGGTSPVATSVGGLGGVGMDSPQGASSTRGAGGSGEVVGGTGAGGGGGLQSNDPPDWGGPGAAGGPGFASVTITRTSSAPSYSTITAVGAFSYTVPQGYAADITIIGAGGGGGAPEFGGGTMGSGGGSGGYLTVSNVVAGATVTGNIGTGGAGGVQQSGSGDYGSTGGPTTLLYNGTTYTAGGGGGGVGSYGGYAVGVGGTPDGTPGLGPQGANGGPGGNSYYTTLFGTTTAGTGGYPHGPRDGTPGQLGGGGGGASGSNNDGALGNGAKGGDGLVVIALRKVVVSTTAMLFDDGSGQSNHFIGLNVYREASWRECWMKDSPSHNFPILDYSAEPVLGEKSLVRSNGALDFASSGIGSATYSQGTTLSYLSGKQYIEFGAKSVSGTAYPKIILFDSATNRLLATIPASAAMAANDVAGVAINFNTGQYWLRQNTNVWGSGSPETGSLPTGTFTPTPTGVTVCVSCDGGASGWLNFGQRDYNWAAPTGFDTGSLGPRPGLRGYVFNYVIDANTTNFNLRNAAINAGWDQSTPLEASLTINSGVVLGSSSIASWALDTDTNYPASSKIVITNHGYLVGKGGDGGVSGHGNGYDGGPALLVRTPVVFDNQGVIGGGGGGGSTGPDPGVGGGNGPAGAGYVLGATRYPQALPQTVTTGGSPDGAHFGGSLGQPGAAWDWPGGQPGAAISGNSYITWLNTGTRLGSIS